MLRPRPTSALRPAILAVAIFGLQCGDNTDAATVQIGDDEAAAEGEKKPANPNADPKAPATTTGTGQTGDTYGSSFRGEPAEGPFDQFDDTDDQFNRDRREDPRDELRDKLREDVRDIAR
jgi:hypothetical protein